MKPDAREETQTTDALDKRRWIPWALWLGYGLCWTAALLLTVIVEARDEVLDEEVGYSAGKMLHVVAYAGFAVLTSRLPTKRLRRWLLLGLVSLHAAVTELVQQFVGRTSSLFDVGLDHVGILLGVAVTWSRWIRRS